MEVGHDEETDGAGDDAEEFDAVETADAAGEAVADLTVKDDDGSAAGEDDGS